MNPLAWQNAYDVLHCNNNFNSLAERLFLYNDDDDDDNDGDDDDVWNTL